MGWTKRQEALDYLRDKKAYHFIMSGACYSERGSRHFGRYMALCRMLGEVPDQQLQIIYGEADEANAGSREVPRERIHSRFRR